MPAALRSLQQAWIYNSNIPDGADTASWTLSSKHFMAE